MVYLVCVPACIEREELYYCTEKILRWTSLSGCVLQRRWNSSSCSSVVLVGMFSRINFSRSLLSSPTSLSIFLCYNMTYSYGFKQTKHSPLVMSQTGLQNVLHHYHRIADNVVTFQRLIKLQKHKIAKAASLCSICIHDNGLECAILFKTGEFQTTACDLLYCLEQGSKHHAKCISCLAIAVDLGDGDT